MVAALGHGWMNRLYKGPHCGKKIKVKNVGGGPDGTVHGKGNTVVVQLVDSCDGCHGDHIDLSSEAWRKLTNGHVRSKVNVEWYVALHRVSLPRVLICGQVVCLAASRTTLVSCCWEWNCRWV